MLGPCESVLTARIANRLLPLKEPGVPKDDGGGANSADEASGGVYLTEKAEDSRAVF